MKRFMIPLTVVLILLIALTACGGKKKAAEVEPTEPPAAAESAPASEPAVTSEPTEVPPPAPTATAVPSPTIAPTLPPTAAAEEELPTGKTIPKTFVMTMEMKEEVVKPTEEVKDWVIAEFTMQVEPEPGAMSITVTDQLSDDPTESMRMINLADASYMFDPEEGVWLKLPRGASQTSGTLIDMADFSSQNADQRAKDIFNQAHLVDRHETVDGVDTTHYRLTDADVDLLQNDWMSKSQEKLISGQADYWIANDGNYLKKSEFVGIVEDSQGQQKRNYMRMFISAENQPVDIQAPPEDQVRDMLDLSALTQKEETPPAETEAGAPPEASAAALALLEKIPAPPASKELAEDQLSDDVKFFAQMMAQAGPHRIYESTASVEAVRDFYKEELDKLGLTSLMGDQAPETNMAIFMGPQGGVQILTQPDPATGNTIVFVQVMGE